jgi:hypothetical protein
LSDNGGKKIIKSQMNKATEGILGGFFVVVETHDDCPTFKADVFGQIFAVH